MHRVRDFGFIQVTGQIEKEVAAYDEVSILYDHGVSF